MKNEKDLVSDLDTLISQYIGDVKDNKDLLMALGVVEVLRNAIQMHVVQGLTEKVMDFDQGMRLAYKAHPVVFMRRVPEGG